MKYPKPPRVRRPRKKTPPPLALFIPTIQPEYRPYVGVTLRKKKKIKPTYTPTLVGMEFLPRVRATKRLGRRIYGGIAPRPLAV